MTSKVLMLGRRSNHVCGRHILAQNVQQDAFFVILPVFLAYFLYTSACVSLSFRVPRLSKRGPFFWPSEPAKEHTADTASRETKQASLPREANEVNGNRLVHIYSTISFPFLAKKGLFSVVQVWSKAHLRFDTHIWGHVSARALPPGCFRVAESGWSTARVGCFSVVVKTIGTQPIIDRCWLWFFVVYRASGCIGWTISG